MKRNRQKITLASYVQNKVSKYGRQDRPFRTECHWSLVDNYQDTKIVQDYYQNWVEPFQERREEKLNIRYRGVKAWDDQNYDIRTFEELAKNKHWAYVLERTLKKSNNFYFLGRLDIHSDIIIKFLKEEKAIDLLAETDRFHIFLRGREVGIPVSLSQLSFLKPDWTRQEQFKNYATLIQVPEEHKLGDCERFWQVLQNDDYKAILIKGAKSIGKTTGVKYYLETLPQQQPVLCLTHRQSLAENLAEKLNLTNYKKLSTYDDPKAIRMSLCINSLVNLYPYICQGKYKDTVVIVDEIMSLLPVIGYRGEKIDMNHLRNDIMISLKKLFEGAGKVIIIDADLDAFVAEFCLKIFGPEATHVIQADRPLPYSKPVKVISHDDKRCLSQYVKLMLNDPDVYPAIMFLATVEGTYEAKELYEELYPDFNRDHYEQEIPEGIHPEVLMLNSKTGTEPQSKEFFKDPKGYIERMRLKLLVATNIVDAGLSIDVYKYFKTVVIATTFNHISPLTMAQQALRLRDLDAPRIFFIPQNVIRTNLDLKNRKNLTVKAQRFKWIDDHLKSETARKRLSKALEKPNGLAEFQRFLGLKDLKAIENLQSSLYRVKETLKNSDTTNFESSPYLDLLFDAITFDCKMKNNFSEVIIESLLLDDNELEHDTFTETPPDENAENPPTFSPEEIEEIINRENKGSREAYQNGDYIDEIVYKNDQEFGHEAHTIPELVAIYKNPKQLSSYQKSVKLAKSLFLTDMTTRMCQKPYVLDWEEHEHKANTLELAGFKKLEQELLNGKVSRGKVSEILNFFKDQEAVKEEVLRQFFRTNKKDIARNTDVIEILKKAFGVKFGRRSSGYYPITNQDSLSYKLLRIVLLKSSQSQSERNQ